MSASDPFAASRDRSAPRRRPRPAAPAISTTQAELTHQTGDTLLSDVTPDVRHALDAAVQAGISIGIGLAADAIEEALS